ncbi:MAG TPA: ABC transporter permease [Rhodothermales bacterium]|nr:ABC transporter permease [Rhodothermales bacterium]
MGTATQFDLEAAIATWCRFLASACALSSDDLDELEGHLRDEMDALVAEGMPQEMAFREARRRVGDYATVKEAYDQLYWRKVHHERRLTEELSIRLTMLNNYLKIALRNLRRQAGYTFLNVTGLAVGIACCLLILLYVQDERAFDRYHKQADHIVRAVLDLETPTGTNALTAGPAALAPTILAEIPEVERAVRFYHPSSVPVRYGDEPFQEEAFFFADSSVFGIFDFELIAGNPRTALATPYSLVLTEETAHRYFGADDPMGQVLTVNDSLQFEVTGIVADIPAQSHFRFDFLASFSSWEALVPSLVDTWSPHIYYTYLLLSPGTTAEAVEARLPQLVEENANLTRPGWSFNFQLQPLTSIHLYSHRNDELGSNGRVENLYLFGVIAVFILLIACVNFMNLTTARAGNRMQEVGMRKVLGAHRKQLAGQFLGEAFLLSFASVALALGLALLALPLFNTLSGKTGAVADLLSGPTLLALIVIGLVVGLLAGTYPAFVLSSFRPLAVFKGGAQVGRQRGAIVLRKGLVVFQFAVSIFLISGSAIVYSQLDYMRSRPLGFAPEQVVVLSGLKGSQLDLYETLKEELGQLAAVEGVAASNGVPGRQNLGLSIQTEGMAEDEWRVMNVLFVDLGFAEAYQMDMVAGRDFAEGRDTDSTRNFILNETAVANLGWTPQEAVGKPFALTRGRGEVVGVVRDFHYAALQHRVEPLAIRSSPVAFGSAPLYVSLRISTQQANRVLPQLEAVWNSIVPGRPFTFFFLNADFDRQYRAEDQLSQLVSIFAVLATLIACLGLFGLAAHTAEQRTKEIGVRKVLGASVSGIVALLSKDFLKLVLLGFAIATPISYFAMHRWLDDFAYRVEIAWWIFLIVGFAALIIALLTVSYQAIRAATLDPVKALRYE